jgi:hypothetical protein
VASIFEQHSVVVRVFEDRMQAVAALRDLYLAGFREEEIGIARLRVDGDLTEAESIPEAELQDASGSFVECFAESHLGEIGGIGISAGEIPAIGSVIAGGTLAPILVHQSEKDILRGTLGAIAGEAYPREEASFYEEQVKAGRTIVAVSADQRYRDAAEILAQDGGYDLERLGP